VKESDDTAMAHRSPLRSLPVWERAAKVGWEKTRLRLRQEHAHFSTTTSTSTSNRIDTSANLLLRQEKDGVLTLNLNRSRQHNALNQTLLHDLKQELERAQNSLLGKDDGNDPLIRSIVLQSNGSVFSSGHDLKEMNAMSSSEQMELMQLCSYVMQLLSEVPQPTVAVVEGLATAAGCQMAAACDLVVASREKAQFSTPGATTIGLFCHTPAVPLVRCIGLKRAKAMLYTGQVLAAQEALEYGLVSHLVNSIDTNPKEFGAQLAREIANNVSFPALALGKKTLHRQMEAPSLKQAYNIASEAMVENLQTQDGQNPEETSLVDQFGDLVAWNRSNPS